ncbi:MAG TPA: hypothetical protein VK552_09855 [Reyranella sp.]|nr:hypothetical protein [Reyranella sp.]
MRRLQRWRVRPGVRFGEFPHFPQFPQAVLNVEVVQRRKIIIGISRISAGRFVELPKA